VVELVKTGRLPEARLDQSLRRLLRLKFQLGLFDNPFVDEAQVPQVLGHPGFRCGGRGFAAARHDPAQKRRADLPLQGQPKILSKISIRRCRQYAQVVEQTRRSRFRHPAPGTPWVPVETKNPFA
jgi:beta-glucosidase